MRAVMADGLWTQHGGLGLCWASTPLRCGEDDVRDEGRGLNTLSCQRQGLESLRGPEQASCSGFTDTGSALLRDAGIRVEGLEQDLRSA